VYSNTCCSLSSISNSIYHQTCQKLEEYAKKRSISIFFDKIPQLEKYMY